jgi:hypothetical protein
MSVPKNQGDDVTRQKMQEMVQSPDVAKAMSDHQTGVTIESRGKPNFLSTDQYDLGRRIMSGQAVADEMPVGPSGAGERPARPPPAGGVETERTDVARKPAPVGAVVLIAAAALLAALLFVIVRAFTAPTAAAPAAASVTSAAPPSEPPTATEKTATDPSSDPGPAAAATATAAAPPVPAATTASPAAASAATARATAASSQAPGPSSSSDELLFRLKP